MAESVIIIFSPVGFNWNGFHSWTCLFCFFSRGLNQMEVQGGGGFGPVCRWQPVDSNSFFISGLFLGKGADPFFFPHGHRLGT